MISTEHSNVLEPLLADRTLKQIFSPFTCAICHYFNENNPASYRCTQCAPNTSIYYCKVHVLKVPEHQTKHAKYHQPDEIYKKIFDNDFEPELIKKLGKMTVQLKSEQQQLNNNRRNMKKSFDYHLENMCETFLNEIEAHRKMLHIEIDRVAAARGKDLEQVEVKIVEEKKFLRDFVDDIEYDSIEFINSATVLQTEAKTYTPEIGPFTAFIPPPGGVLTTLLSAEYVKIARMDSVNRYWRDVGAVGYMTLHPSQLQNWNLRDIPVITIPHPDWDKLGAPFLEEMFLIGRKAVDTQSVKRITSISELLTAPKGDQVPIIMYEGEDRNLHRVAVRHLTESFEKLTKQPTLEIVYEPCDLPLEVVLKPLQTLTLRNVNYFYKKDHFGTAMNTFLCFCHNNDEMAMIKGIIDNEPTIWQRHGIKTIRAYLRGSIVLTHVDDPVPCPMVVSETLLRHNRFFECPPELVVSEHRPGMMVEVWLDNQHPSNKSKNFDPFLKQVHFSETSYHVRRLIQTASNFKIEFIRQLAAERIPWAWIGSVKANGENIESKVDHMFSKRRGYPIKDTI